LIIVSRKFNPNFHAAARTAFLGRKHSAETKARIGAAALGRRWSESSKLNQSAAKKAVPMSQAVKDKIAAGMTGKKWPAERKRAYDERRWEKLAPKLMFAAFKRERRAGITLEKAWLRHPLMRKRASLGHYYCKHEENKTKQRARARKRYNCLRSDPIFREMRRQIQLRASRKWRLKMKSSARYRIERNLRTRLSGALKRASTSKTDRTLALCGCSTQFLIAHLESQFEFGMSWQNYGRDGWHIDHIKAIATFDLSKPAQQRKCFHYSNLRPLWSSENRMNGNLLQARLRRLNHL
jgi:hypothetical protein